MDNNWAMSWVTCYKADGLWQINVRIILMYRSKMDWTEEQQCVICDRGGDLLVCNGDGCPISVHKSCMGCKTYLDDGGNFYCPYCTYKQFMAQISKSREKALLTKKNLSAFLEKETGNIKQQEPIVGMTSKEKETSSKEQNVDVNNLVQNRWVKNHQQSETPLPSEETRDTLISEQVNTCRIMVVYNPNSNADDASGLDCKADQLESDISLKTKVDNQTGTTNHQPDTYVQSKSVEIVSIEKEITSRKRKQTVAFNKSGISKKQKECIMEDGADKLKSSQNVVQLQSKPHSRIDPKDINISKSDPKELKDSCNPQLKPTRQTNEGLKDGSLDRSIKLPLQTEKRRVLWTEQEEYMLKEGVEKFSSSGRKNLPWKKILDFGRHVFHPYRNPSDLKDKWRKIGK
ncbi:uncharacterized protein [Rutidosis leptorrhynchoides]|uniref:uncharacterized protein n=1 Tax=Rutidosis leptorrhynchoides TaxID=125765 RepID=UPI003A9A443D